jgi:hypothetical protein
MNGIVSRKLPRTLLEPIDTQFLRPLRNEAIDTDEAHKRLGEELVDSLMNFWAGSSLLAARNLRYRESGGYDCDLSLFRSLHQRATNVNAAMFRHD